MKVVTIGELVVDWIAVEKSASWQDPQTFIRSLGGNAANVALGLSRLGADVRLVAKVGADLHGNYLLQHFNSLDIDTTFVFQTEKFPTAQCYVLTDDGGENLFFNWPKPNACHQLTEDEFDPAIFTGAFCLHATGISLTVEPRDQFIIKAIREARSAGLLVSFDAGFPTGEGERAQKLVREAMSLSHLLKVNLPELIYWLVPSMAPDKLANILENPGEPANLEVLKEFCRQFREKAGANVLLCTLGAYGSIVTTQVSQAYAPPLKLEAVAGVGAGDAFVAAVLYRMARALKEQKADSRIFTGQLDHQNWTAHAAFANAAGALATRTVSASEGLPTLAEIEALLTTIS